MNQVWELLGGIVIFIIGMHWLEEALKKIAGRSFKLFLKKQTSNKVKGILGGALVTAILQSSSVVNIMVLAFVGANVLQMENALALMLGSNLGTTFTSWIIALVGFKLNIEALAWPLTGIAGLIWTMVSPQNRFYFWIQFLLGFGFLLLGLYFMQTGVASSLEWVNLEQFNRSPLIVFLLLGAVITTIVQASSATIALTLAVLHAGGISLEAAAAIVLGAEVGTTSKLLLLAQGKLADKKRVALGNFLFNTISSLLAFAAIGPLLYFIKQVIGVSDELTALAFFQTLVNLLGIVLFFPFLQFFGRFLQNLYSNNQQDTSFIHKVSINEPELALQAIQEEIRHFLLHLFQFTLDALDIKNSHLPPASWKPSHEFSAPADRYEYLKDLHGDIQQYYVQLQTVITEKEQTMLLDQLLSALRNGMYGAKSIKDAMQDADLLSNSSNDSKYAYYQMSQQRMEQFLGQTIPYLTRGKTATEEALKKLFTDLADNYTQAVVELYGKNRIRQLTDIELSTLVNYNRELYTAKKSILMALKDLLLTPEEAAAFRDLPGFIR
jgi:phosphate:Na+ symporter